MKNIVTAWLIAASTLTACNNPHNHHTQKELGTVLDLPWPQKNTAVDKTVIVFWDTMEADRKEEFVANGWTAHGDTSSNTIHSADIN